ncbi:hypothetical protein OXX80_000554 [Metschnikowia pulcherrima]
MSYNGIGLQTPRGSGTSGYVQKNVVAKNTEGVREKRKREAENEHRRMIRAKMNEARRNAGADVRSHDEKRYVEVKCMELRESLEDEDVEDAEIDKKVASFRVKLLAEQGDRTEERKSESQTDEGQGSLDNTPSVPTEVNKHKNAGSETTADLPKKETAASKSVYDYVPRYDKR